MILTGVLPKIMVIEGTSVLPVSYGVRAASALPATARSAAAKKNCFIVVYPVCRRRASKRHYTPVPISFTISLCTYSGQNFLTGQH